MGRPGRRGWAVGAVALLATIGLGGCERIPPVLTVEPARFVVGTQLGPSQRATYADDFEYVTVTKVPMLLQWSATDNNTLCRLTYSLLEDGSHWQFPMFTETHLTERLVVGDDDQDNFGGPNLSGWTVRAHDCSGNTADVGVSSAAFVTQDDGYSQAGFLPGAITTAPTGAWTTRDDPALSGGSTLETTTAGATVTYTHDYPDPRTPVAVVMSRLVGGGDADILVDGRKVATVHGITIRAPRTIVWAGTIAAAGVHTITVRAHGGEAIEVDAFVYRGVPVW